MNLRKTINIISYVVTPLALVVASIGWPQKDTFLFFGEVAQFLLFGILFIKPIAVISGIAWLRRNLAYRRQLGVMAFWTALFHSVLFIYDKELYSVSDFVGFDNYLSYGAWALVGMIILGITSNTVSVRLLKRNWKRVQYIAYPTLFLTLLHTAMIEGELAKFFVIGGVYSILKIVEWSGFKLNL